MASLASREIYSVVLAKERTQQSYHFSMEGSLSRDRIVSLIGDQEDVKHIEAYFNTPGKQEMRSIELHWRGEHFNS